MKRGDTASRALGERRRLVDDPDRYAAPGEIKGERQPRRAGSDNEYIHAAIKTLPG